MGYIGVQNHDGKSTVYFKEISVSPLEGSTPMQQGERDRLLSYMHATRKLVVDSATGLTDEQMNYKPAPDRWSVAEVLEHLTLSERNIFRLAMSGLQSKEAAPANRVKDEELVAMIQDRSQKAEDPPASGRRVNGSSSR